MSSNDSNGAGPKKPAPMIHTQKLFGGVKTAEEIYAEIAVNRPCYVCSLPGITRLATLVSYRDMLKKRPWVIATIMAVREPGAEPPIIRTKHGAMICVAEVAACKACTPQAEREASAGERKLSGIGIMTHVEIRRGPGIDKPVFQVPNTPTPVTPPADN